jgi:hypothetical protein
VEPWQLKIREASSSGEWFIPIQTAPQHRAADGTAVEVGQSWAYRARYGDELVQVTVVRLGKRRPARALVRFDDAEFEGLQDWVPPARLKVSWSDVAGFRAREERWNKIHAAGLPLDDPREGAAEIVLEMLLGDDQVSLGYRESGAIRLGDPAGIASRLGLDVEQLTGHPLGFSEDGALIVPWNVTELIVMTAARLNPGPILEYVAQEERKAKHEAIHGSWSRGGRRGRDHYFEPDLCAEVDEEYQRPRRDILRRWCGAEASDRFDELSELREEIRRLTQVAQSAIDALRQAGNNRQASKLQRELGTPGEKAAGQRPGA